MKRKKKNKFLNGYTNFQKFWIIFLLIVLFISLCLTVYQVGVILFGNKQTTVQDPISSVQEIEQVEEEDPTILKVSEDAGKEYVDDTLFLGDSNTVRFMEFTDDDGNTYTTKENTIAVVGMGVQAIDNLDCMEFSTGTFTMVESVKILQPKRIIITFGTNNLNGDNTSETREAFIESYTKQLKEIQEAYPSADIIVNSLPPITPTTVYTNLDAEEILAWNQAMIKMCEENSWHYLNSSEVLADQTTGYALDGMMDQDGLHLSKKGVSTLFSYIRTHAYITEDTRGELEEIPTIIGPKTTLYQVDPLSGNTFDDSVLHPTDTQSVESQAPVQDVTPNEPVVPDVPTEETPIENTPVEEQPTEDTTVPTEEQTNTNQVDG